VREGAVWRADAVERQARGLEERRRGGQRRQARSAKGGRREEREERKGRKGKKGKKKKEGRKRKKEENRKINGKEIGKRFKKLGKIARGN
jgi:hypothetical protein